MSLEPASSSTAPSTTERTLARLSTLLSSTSGIDKAYRLLIYSLRILALSTAKRHGPQHPLVTGVAAFTGPLADTRVVLRMFGLLPMVQEVLRLRRESIAHAASAASSAVSSSSASASGNGTRKTGTDNALLGLTPALIERLQVWAMLVYYPCEHVYWLGEHKVFPSSWIREPYWWSRVSCRAWALWIVLDLVNVVREFQPVLATVRQQSGTSTSSKSNTSTATATTLADARGKLDDLKLRLIALATDLPLAVHWSLASYPMPEMWVGVLGLVSTVAGSTLKWKYTR